MGFFTPNYTTYYLNLFPIGEFTNKIIESLEFWTIDYNDTYFINFVEDRQSLGYREKLDCISLDCLKIIYMSSSGRGIIYYRDRKLAKIDDKSCIKCKVGYLLDGKQVEDEKDVIIDITSYGYDIDYKLFDKICEFCKPFIDKVESVQ